MKKIFRYLGALLSVALMGAFTACNPVEENLSADLGLGIKVFFPTKVVTGQPMTINGSGFSDAVEIVFPDGVVVKDFEIVTNDMIRVTAPAGISAQGGKILVRTASDEAESRLALTVGKTVVTGFSKQAGETVKGGEQITIYGEDLEFINSVELLDEDGNPLILTDADFYRKGTSSVVITVPRDVFSGPYVAKITTFDGREFMMDEFIYETAPIEGGYFETTKTPIWTNDGSKGAISWSSDYRFSSANASTGEELYAIPMDIWERMKSETFYLTIEATDPQIRVTTGWWSSTWTGNDIVPGNDKLTDNGDGTFTLEINLAGDPVLDLIDVQHLLFTGDRYNPVELYFMTETWVEGGAGAPVVKDVPVWTNDGSKGAISWSSDYRFSSADASTGEEIYAFPMDVWERMKSETFYLKLEATDPQIRVTTGWWSSTWTGNDIVPGNDKLTDNGDGTFTLEINLAGDPVLDLIDVQHLLFTGDRYTPLEIFFKEVTVGVGPAPSQSVFWENDGSKGTISWSSDYRFSSADASTGEEICAIPMDIWEKLKSNTFYLDLKATDPQIRVTTGWWSSTWTGNDIFAGDDKLTDNGDGTFTLEINLAGDPVLDLIDVQHLLFTGDRYIPLKLYFK